MLARMSLLLALLRVLALLQVRALLHSCIAARLSPVWCLSFRWPVIFFACSPGLACARPGVLALLIAFMDYARPGRNVPATSKPANVELITKQANV
jgi:hypothetical protein